MVKAATKEKDVSGKKPEEQHGSQEAKRRPIRTLRVGDCSASIWARTFAVQGQPTTFYSLTLERSYKDRDGAWKYTKSLDADSLGQVIALCQQASEVIGGLQHDDALAHERKEER